MLEHVEAVKSLLEPLGYPVHVVSAPEGALEDLPYLLVWTSSGDPEAPALDDAATDLAADFGVTATGADAEAVFIVQRRVRSVLAPGGRVLELSVPGRRAWLRLERSRPVEVDRDAKVPGSTAHPAFGVDVYRLISTPA